MKALAKMIDKLHKIRQSALDVALGDLFALDAQKSLKLEELKNARDKINTQSLPSSGSIFNFISQSEQRAILSHEIDEILEQIGALEVKREELREKIMHANMELEKINYLKEINLKEAKNAQRIFERKQTEEPKMIKIL